MIENVTALIVQTPAASPSTPSEKFTTFISPTSPITVIAPAASPKLIAPMNGTVTFVTFTPAATGTTAASVWPASFHCGARSSTSSSAPTIVISRAPIRIPRVSLPLGRYFRPAISTPAAMARPPSRGVARSARPRARGWSTAPRRTAIRAAPIASTELTTIASRKA